ncbi:GNAT family N-acetyltransferase [Pseudobdellovibrio exovorus]|uniref:GNAT family N-acetyltransferase n=1 Tax=Pseudobdellovibrio exovorus TaxID=453816 RepID=UPI0006865BBE|nr:GNAT family N-acetyltransferase [Pseudobdellovibrio exovorus]
MVSMIDQLVKKGRVYYTGLSNWKSKAELNIEVGPYKLQVAQNQSQVLECFRLRYEVFCHEMAGLPKKSGLDFDKYDHYCDHLIIIHQPTQKVIGTYRMNFSETSESLYTESEFELTEWLSNQRDSFVELGRACIHREHRRGVVLSLLWRGIADYMKLMGAAKLIGCSSVKVTDARSAALLFKYFEAQQMLSAEIFYPHEKYQMPDLLFWLMAFAKGLNPEQMQEAEDLIPSLLKSYIKSGAKVASYPALDNDFKCLDFVTILERQNLDQKLVKKFNL